MRKTRDVKVEKTEREKSGCKEGERREERGYSSLVFQLITTESPAAAVRHISPTVFFFFFITNIN